MDFFDGGAANYLAGALSVLDVHAEKGFDHQMKAAAGKLPHPSLSLMQHGPRPPARADDAIGFIDELDQGVKCMCRGGSVGIDVTDDIRRWGEFQAFDERAALANRVREIQRANALKLGCDSFDHPKRIIPAAVQDHHELKLALIIVSEVCPKLAQDRFNPRLFVIGGDQEQQAGCRHEGFT